MSYNKIIKIEDSVCDLCGACVGICVENCISLFEHKISIDRDACSLCGSCIVICPLKVLSYGYKESI